MHAIQLIYFPMCHLLLIKVTCNQAHPKLGQGSVRGKEWERPLSPFAIANLIMPLYTISKTY